MPSAPPDKRFDALKSLIFEAAGEVPAIGRLEESLKWGQPSFAPKKNSIGSSVRIESRANGDHALMFICTTGLVDTFAELYGDQFELEGKRAIVLAKDVQPDRAALKHCIQLALTHKLRKRG